MPHMSRTHQKERSERVVRIRMLGAPDMYESRKSGGVELGLRLPQVFVVLTGISSWRKLKQQQRGGALSYGGPGLSCRPSTNRRHLGRMEYIQTRAKKEEPKSNKGTEKRQKIAGMESKSGIRREETDHSDLGVECTEGESRIPVQRPIHRNPADNREEQSGDYTGLGAQKEGPGDQVDPGR